MSYEPNKWFVEPINRSVVEACKAFEDDFVLLLRPSRRFLFFGAYQPKEHTPDFTKPCLGALAYRNDVDKKPQLVIETEPLSDSLRQVYVENEILWVEIFPGQNGLCLVSEHSGVRLDITAPANKLTKMLAAPLSWVREKIAQPQGKLIQSYHERLIRDSIESLNGAYKIQCHHQVPFGYVTGYRLDMPKPIARTSMDIVLTLDYDTDPDGSVILPIKIDLHNSHLTDPFKAEKDKMIEQFAEDIRMPLMKIYVGENSEQYTIECPVLNLCPATVTSRNRDDWANALTPFIREAIRYAGR